MATLDYFGLGRHGDAPHDQGLIYQALGDHEDVIASVVVHVCGLLF
jgi:hypothetical protein